MCELRKKETAIAVSLCHFLRILKDGYIMIPVCFRLYSPKTLWFKSGKDWILV